MQPQDRFRRRLARVWSRSYLDGRRLPEIRRVPLRAVREVKARGQAAADCLQSLLTAPAMGERDLSRM